MTYLKADSYYIEETTYQFLQHDHALLHARDY